MTSFTDSWFSFSEDPMKFCVVPLLTALVVVCCVTGGWSYGAWHNMEPPLSAISSSSAHQLPSPQQAAAPTRIKTCQRQQC